MSSYIVVLVMPWCLLALAVILAVIRVDRADLLDMVRAIMGRNDDEDGPPSLPKPLARRVALCHCAEARHAGSHVGSRCHATVRQRHGKVCARNQVVAIAYHDWLTVGGLSYVRFANRQIHGRPE